MIQFTEHYFEKENRCGFEISHMMKCAWAAQLEVLLQIVKVCEAHDLQYFAYFGTLLGAVRHKGFIPWDDDIDIAMKREDYIRFLTYAQEELPEGYKVLTPYTEREWTEGFSRVTNSNKIDVSEERLSVYHGCPFAIGIDVFPLDYVPKAENIKNYQKQMLQLAKESFYCILYLQQNGENGLASKEELAAYKQKLAGDLKILGDFTGIKRENAFSLSNWVLRMFDAICMLCDEENADTICSFQIHLDNVVTTEVRKKALAGSRLMNFETIMINVPVGYEEVLTQNYGDYRKLCFSPCHDYPFYKKQIPAMQGKHIWDEKELRREMNRILPKSLESYGNVIANLQGEWKHKLEKAKALGKTVVLLETSVIDFFMYEGAYIDCLKNTVKQAYELKDKLFIWWRPDKVEGCIYGYMHPELMEKYKQCMDFFIEKDLGILDTTKELARAISETDVFYGDKTTAMERCQTKGIPCFLLTEDELTLCTCIRSMDMGEEKKNTENCVQEKKTILYITNEKELLKYGEEYIGKIENSLGIFYEAKDKIELVWKTYRQRIPDTNSDNTMIMEQYQKTIRSFQESGWGKYEEGNEWESILEKCNGYYGDMTGIVQICKSRKIPVMIQNIQIL